jgi:replication factor A1
MEHGVAFESYTPSPSKQMGWLGDRIQPIASLNPYQSRWAIKARVTNKSEVKVWKNDRGEGKLFSVDLLDQQGGQIKATMFNDAVDKFFQILQPNHVYIIGKGILKMANKKFSVIPNDYEMTLNADAEIEAVEQDDSILEQKFTFVPIDQLCNREADDTVDVLGVVQSVSKVLPVMSKQSGKHLVKRLVVLTDSTLLSVELTLWGDTAEKNGETMINQVIAVKACKVSAYGAKGSRSLSTLFGSRLFLSPELAEAKTLLDWYNSTGKDAKTELITVRGEGSGGIDPRKTFAQLKVEDLGLRTEKSSFFFVSRCTPIFYRHAGDKPPYYNACPTPACNRKVNLNDSTKQWHCEKCEASFPSPSPRYILSVQAVDATGECWLTAFNEVAEFLLRHSAQAVSEFKEAGNSKAYEQVFKDAIFKTYLFKCRAKQETIKETNEVRTRFHVIAATPVNYKQECHLLLDEIGTYLPLSAS